MATDHHRVRPSATGAPPTRPPPPCNLQASAHHGALTSPQDGEFWLTADEAAPAASCSGFNLWILLDHVRMNYSFDLFDVDKSRPLYAAGWPLIASDDH
jgi:hypothetical protein